MKEIEYFVRIAGDNLFKQWLDTEKAKTTKLLANAEGVTLHRAQGRYSTLNEIENLMEQAKVLR